MNERILIFPAVLLLLAIVVHSQTGAVELPSKWLSSAKHSLTITGLFYKTSSGRNYLPDVMVAQAKRSGALNSIFKMADGRTVSISILPDGKNFNTSLSAQPSDGIIKWGLSLDSVPDEYYTGLMERRSRWAATGVVGAWHKGMRIEPSRQNG